MTNLTGSIRVLYDCPVSSDSVNQSAYSAGFAPQSNQVLLLTWQLRIEAVKPGTIGGVVIQVPISGNDESIAVAFNDGGQIFAVTNVLASVSDLVTIGSWSNLVGTVMTNELILNYPAHTMTLSVNGNLIGTLPMRPDATNYVRSINFEIAENTAYGSSGNRIAIDEVQVMVVAPQLAITRSGVNVVLTWPTNAAGFILESTTNLAPPAIWSTNLPAPVVVNGQINVTNPITGTRQLFRLKQ